jgi:hypothetical protein
MAPEESGGRNGSIPLCSILACAAGNWRVIGMRDGDSRGGLGRGGGLFTARAGRGAMS